MMTIAENLEKVRLRIVQACQAVGRDPQSVTLLAVSKTWPASAVVEALRARQFLFGENYLQEAVEKIQTLAKNPLNPQETTAVQWHCIGPIQSNKTKLVAEYFDWAHTVDRLKVAQRLNDQRPAHLPPLQVCIQVNMDGQASKSGVAPEQALALAQSVTKLPSLRLRGLMSIPLPEDDFSAQLQVHQRTKRLFDEIATSAMVNAAHFDTLSMGMSADLEAAVAAGATMVRVGTAIFGTRDYPPKRP